MPRDATSKDGRAPARALRLDELMNIFEKLRQEHDKTRTLLDLVAKTHGDSNGRRELFGRLKDELEAHTAAEEVSLYKPLIGTHAQDKATHSTKEHEQTRELIEELEAMDFSSPGWLTRFEALDQLVRGHMDQEEHKVFQQAGRTLTDPEKDALAAVHERERAQMG